MCVEAINLYFAIFAYFCNSVLKEILGVDSVDKLVQQCTKILTDDVKNSDTDQLFRIAYDLLEPTKSGATSPSFIMEKRCWSFRKQITVESMINTFNSVTKQEKTTRLKLLNEFILRINELQALKYLPSMCKMIHMLYFTFNRQMDKQNATMIKVSDLTQAQNTQTDPSFKEILRAGVHSFREAWAILSPSFADPTWRNKLNKFESDDKSAQDSLPLSYLLPNTSNNGVYMYYLVSYLIQLHNEFVQFYLNFKTAKNNCSTKAHVKVELENLTPNDCICFTSEKEILKIVYTHSNYSLENVQESNLEYDFVKIQKTIENRFLIDKPFIEIKVNF